ncbi:tyrosine-type recombinase/integrase [Clostridium chromiireducens]|jgi:Site-specific recombinase XerD|uniref:Tyrosine-type recombinase/integrase n=1 Tax=Clostridium chromiireducens TaxID=225345 RepID=A0A964RL33_9CLOT|nr:tyrosine-type recombinase/integrase [Clostridium chromiireducens]MVX63733.1 tyrosine-type recombinase/integrase [Clostridium chromiireducens]
MGKNSDELLLELESKLPGYVKDYSKRISSTTTAKTNIAYLGDILTFFEYCSLKILNKDVKDITVDDLGSLTDIHIYDYLNYLGKYTKTHLNKAGKPVTKTYRNTESGKSRKLSAIKSLYKKLKDSNLIKNNPVLTVNQNTPPYIGIRERLTKEEVEALEYAVMQGINIDTELSQQAYERNKKRDTALMLIFLYSGIRVSELANLNINDIDITNSTMTIIRKGNKKDKIPFPDVVADFFNDYICIRKNMEGISTNALFISQFKSRITVKSIENIIKKYADRANITKKVTPHTLRRTFLTTFYNATKDADATRRIAGHDNVNTTLKYYSSTSEEQFKEQLYKFNY